MHGIVSQVLLSRSELDTMVTFHYTNGLMLKMLMLKHAISYHAVKYNIYLHDYIDTTYLLLRVYHCFLYQKPSQLPFGTASHCGYIGELTNCSSPR